MIIKHYYLINMKRILICSLFACILLCGCKNEKNIVLGGVIPMTGGSADLGQSTADAMSLCTDKWNNAGGINGQKIVLDINDSQADPKLGITLTKKIFAMHKPLLVYTLISGVTMNVQSITKQNKTILLACVGSAELFNNDNTYTIRNFVSPTTVGEGISSYIEESAPNKDLTIFFINNTFGDSYAQQVNLCSKKRGINIRQVIPYDDGNNFREIIAKAKLGINDIVYIAGVGQSIGIIIKQLRESGFEGVVLGDPNLQNESAISYAGDAMKNVFYLDVIRPNTDEFNNFRKKYISKHGAEPDNFAIMAYATCDYILNIAAQNNTFDSNEIVKIANDGYTYNSIIGNLSLKNNEFVFPTKISSIK